MLNIEDSSIVSLGSSASGINVVSTTANLRVPYTRRTLARLGVVLFLNGLLL